MTNNEIKELFQRFGASITGDDVWKVQAATVIKHKALERLAAAAGIEWYSPQVLRSERDEAVILVTGKLGEREEWSIGEALINANYRVSGKQAPYVYAMAEKRAKDRVIIKLCGLHGLYSEDEADEFSEQVKPASPPSSPARNAGGSPASSPNRQDEPPATSHTACIATLTSHTAYIATFKLAVERCEYETDIIQLWNEQKPEREKLGITKESPAYKVLSDLCAKQKAVIATMDEGEAA